MSRIGIVVTSAEGYWANAPDRDAAPLVTALTERSEHAEQLIWHDPEVDWASFDVVVLRSPWDYSDRSEEFAAWLDRAGAATRVLNEPELVRWNMDKRYLAQLERAGIAVVPTSYHDDEESLQEALAAHAQQAATEAGPSAEDGSGPEPHAVLKPSVGAGSRLTGLFRPDDPAALDLGRRAMAGRGTVMVQPEIPELSQGREKALYAIDGHVTHAISKGALLARGGGLRGGDYQENPVVVETTDAERAFAERVLAAVSEVTGLAMPLYARIDTVDSARYGLVLLEAELFEPLFNLPLVPEVTEIFADAILDRA